MTVRSGEVVVPTTTERNGGGDEDDSEGLCGGLKVLLSRRGMLVYTSSSLRRMIPS